MKLLAATRSAGKQREIKRVLEPAGFDLVFPDEIGLFESPAEDLLELGESFLTNARSKAEHFARKSGLPTVADDSGLEVFALGGEPGVRSRRWAGAGGTAAEGFILERRDGCAGEHYRGDRRVTADELERVLVGYLRGAKTPTGSSFISKMEHGCCCAPREPNRCCGFTPKPAARRL